MEFSGKKDTPVVPSTKMGKRYERLHVKLKKGGIRKSGDKAKAQLRQAKADSADPSKLASDFIESVEAYTAKYVPRREQFHPQSREEKAWEKKYIDGYRAEKVNTSNIAARASRWGVATEIDGLADVSYVDREIKPSRTTSPSTIANEAGTELTLDLLLADGSRPIVTEVKCRSDESAYYALIQSLAAAAQLSSELQRKRLSVFYPDSNLSSRSKIAVWIMLCDHNSRGVEKREMFEATRTIAKDLLKDKDFRRYVAEIRCVGAKLTKQGPVKLTNDLGDGLEGWVAK